MIEAIERLKSDGVALINDAKTLNDVNNVKVKIFGKNGDFTIAMRGLKDVPREQKPEVGKMFNDVKVMLEGRIAEKEAEFKEIEKQARIKSEYIDVTLPGKTELGALHPLTEVKNQILDTFIGLGFEVKEGPEIESDYFNFQLLNIPKDHPARDMQDSFYITENFLLRTHTSPMQARTMTTEKPPIRIVVPGKVYRNDDDATHSPMFQQVEGLVIDKHITLCDLKGALEVFAKNLFDEKTKVRFRPSYFPFTEPSVEVDVSCSICHGKGCRVCKGTGWIEILGAGIVNPAVLEACGINSKEYSGYAFGFGIERIAMIKYGIPDIRLFFENDKRFLEQYK
ncbi:MAG: phenylalanine--tRNA ligase subunit alpha [Clostridium sp.]|nr:phenylalanine--tRNA ligase subunit alpha [Clostridium sp.]